MSRMSTSVTPNSAPKERPRFMVKVWFTTGSPTSAGDARVESWHASITIQFAGRAPRPRPQDAIPGINSWSFAARRDLPKVRTRSRAPRPSKST